MNGKTELNKVKLQEKIDIKQRVFNHNAKLGVKDYNLLNEINELKDQLSSLDSCDLDDECLNCGS